MNFITDCINLFKKKDKIINEKDNEISLKK